VNNMRKTPYLTSSVILSIIGIIVAFFLYDIMPSGFKIGLNNAKIITHLIIVLIVSLHMLWLAYSKIVSSIQKKDFSKILRKDALTYIPFIVLCFFPLRYLVSNLDSRFVQFIHIPSTVIFIFAFGSFIFLKALFLEISPKKEKSLRNIAIICTLIFFITFSTLSILKHESFFSTGYDLGAYDQTMYGYENGKMLDSLIGFHLLGDHIEWILFIILPIYALFKTPIILIIIQAIFISTGAFIIYILAKKILKNEIAALILCLTYLAHPAIQYALLFDFHTTVLPLPFIILAVYALTQRKYKLLVISLVFTAICKEYFALIMIPFGIFIFFIDMKGSKRFTRFKKISIQKLFSKQRIIGISILLLGITWFLVNINILVPLFHGDSYVYIQGGNSYFGESITETIKIILLNPVYSAKYLFTLNKFAFLILFSASVFFGLFALFAPEYLFLGITELAIILLYTKNSLSEIVYHHQIPLVGFVLAATVIGISRIPKLIKSKKDSKGIIIACSIGVLSTTILANIFFGPFAILYDVNNFNINTPYVKAGNEILSMIPEDASVAAPNWAIPHLSRRNEIYQLRHFIEGLTPNTDYLVMDLSKALTDPKRSSIPFSSEELRILFNKKEYGIIAVKDSWLLFKKGVSYEANICKTKPFLNKSKYPYIDIIIEEKGLIAKC